jgi:hypothetical protein
MVVFADSHQLAFLCIATFMEGYRFQPSHHNVSRRTAGLPPENNIIFFNNNNMEYIFPGRGCAANGLAGLKAVSGVADRNQKHAENPSNLEGEVPMAVVTQDDLLTSRPRKKKGRKKGMAALRKMKRALARRELEIMREDEELKEQIYDVFADEGDS